MLVNFRNVHPPQFREPLLVDSVGLPRFWALVWASFLPGDLAQSTVGKKLSHLGAFYNHADELLGYGGLDRAIAEIDPEALSSALEGYFLRIRNSSSITPASEERWQVAIQFVTEIAQYLSKSPLGTQRLAEFQDRAVRLQLLHAHLHVGRRRRPERVRSLPPDVVEFLYEFLDPTSPKNPIKNTASKWRAYVMFVLLLHQGLRRGELLAMPADVIKGSVDRRNQEERFWMNVRYNDYEEDDPRYSKPSIKNQFSIRQVPVSKTIALVVQEYVTNYRGRPSHSFLMNSQKGHPLSVKGVDYRFENISASLPRSLRKILYDHTGEDSISAHDLRHTCAVVRLSQFLSKGIEKNDAMQRMRAFFGWSRNSEMPLRYARAVFEDRLASVWNDAFDDRVSILRSIPASLS